MPYTVCQMLSTNRLSYLLPRCLLTTHSQPVPALSRLFSSSPPAKHTPQPSSVACLIIGDEILSGKTHDTNSFLLGTLVVRSPPAYCTHSLPLTAKRCFNVGLDLRRIEVVPDVEDNIVSSVQDLSERHRWVFTSGGIGPTHDDITYAAIAKAFRCPLKYHTQTIERMKTIRQITLTDKSHPTPPPLEMTESRKRMALFPAGKDVKVIFPCDHLWVPIVIVQNVHILPGMSPLCAYPLCPSSTLNWASRYTEPLQRSARCLS